MVDEAKQRFKDLDLDRAELWAISQSSSAEGTWTWYEILAAEELLKEGQ